MKDVWFSEASLIKPRAEKSKLEQYMRIKNKGEVFTPSWVCNMQNNQVDEDWFGKKNVFNVEGERCWTTVADRIAFPDGKVWKEYVDLLRMEITCGEAPYLVSLYDSISGESIPLKDRIGLLDRKLRVVTENASSDEWQCWAERAFKATYGYEYQGDSLFLARSNLLRTYFEFYEDKFGSEPSTENMERIAEIISWNIWQMDGIKGIVPLKKENDNHDAGNQISLFDENAGKHELVRVKKAENAVEHKFDYTYCKIMDWQNGKEVSYISLLNDVE